MPSTLLERKKLHQKSRQRFARARKAELSFARQLRTIGDRVEQIIRHFAPDGVVRNMGALERALVRYSERMHDWAKASALVMLRQVDERDYLAWSQLGKTIGRSLGTEIREAPTGKALQEFLAEQVHFITSLPVDAAMRVHKLTLQSLADGGRAKEIAAEILRSGEVTKSRANLIARTEVARTASALTMVRAEYVGSEGYVWRTSLDSDVRQSHRKMEGKFVAWNNPPVLDDGTQVHAGMTYNCRCWPEPVLPDMR